MNYKERVQKLLLHITEQDIVITDHARIRALQRQIDLDEIKKNIINPHRLEYAIREESEKYDCYFGYSKTQCHRYLLKITQKAVVITAIKLNRRWQRIAEGKLRK